MRYNGPIRKKEKRTSRVVPHLRVSFLNQWLECRIPNETPGNKQMGGGERGGNETDLNFRGSILPLQSRTFPSLLLSMENMADSM